MQLLAALLCLNATPVEVDDPESLTKPPSKYNAALSEMASTGLVHVTVTTTLTKPLTWLELCGFCTFRLQEITPGPPAVISGAGSPRRGLLTAFMVATVTD